MLEFDDDVDDDGVGGVVTGTVNEDEEEGPSYLARDSSISDKEMFKCFFIANILSFSIDT